MALDNPSYFTMANPPPLCSLSSSVSSTSSCSSPRSQSKRSLRSLLRSLSTNSADGDSNHELFNTGAPRLSDIAPEFKYASEPRRANSLKAQRQRNSNSTSNNNSNSNSNSKQGNKVGVGALLGLGLDVHRLYSPLPTAEMDADTIDADSEEAHEDEVFVADDHHDASVRYYNLRSAAAPAPRRHSISTLRNHQSQSQPQPQKTQLEKRRQRSSVDLQLQEVQEAVVHATIDGLGQSTASSLASRINLIDDHKLRHGSYPRKRCTKCPRGVTKRADMEDILIFSAKDSEPANLWAQYFVSYFEQISQNANRKPYKIRHLGIEELIASNGDVRHIAERTASVKLQLVILCPLFLEKIQDKTPSLTKLLLPDRILALQLGTTDEDITDLHKETLTAYHQWQRRPVGQDQDQNFALEFVATAIAIFTKIWKQQSSIASEENSHFSIAPKKIRYSQASVLIMLEYPLQHEDIVKISIVKNEEMTEIKSVKRRNPYTLKFTMPERFLEVSAIVNVLVEKNGSIIGKRPIKCESRLRELEQILRSTNNPVEFMCQSLGFSPHDTEQLDNWLVHMFQKNVPPNFNLFVNADSPSGSKHVCELFPTLLHFSARFGLEKLTAQLLDCPGGDLACDIRNVQDFTPADIAENVGHKEINNMLRGYMKMNELATVYTKIKKLTAGNAENVIVGTKEAPEVKNEEDDEEHYLVPKKPELLQMDEFYKMCPAPKPVLQSKSAPSTPATEDAESMPFYIAMDQQKIAVDDHDHDQDQNHDHNYQNFTVTDRNTSSSLPETLIHTASAITAGKSLQSMIQTADNQQKKRNKKHHSSLQSIHSHSQSHAKNAKSINIKEDKVQVELAEIINDFKNNVHTIAQTEQLVAEWQNRNDVQKSFKEKQEQLREMRQRYEQIQRDMKHGGRKSSPFERFKKIFGWSQHNSYQVRDRDRDCVAKCGKEPEGGVKIATGAGDARPISSLSLQSTASSASSGTMSTISGCSLGDSGTHSDHEERKIILSPMEEDLKSPTSMSLNNFNNYLIPPTPRPVKTPLMMAQSFPTIEERVRKDSFERLDPYYIQFPPNGLPISGKLPLLPPNEDIDEVDGASQLFTIPEHMSNTNTRLAEEAKTEEGARCAPQLEYMNLPGCSYGAQHDYMNFKTPS